MTETKAVEVDCEVSQVKTMRDGSYRVVLDVPNYCKSQVKWLLGEAGETDVLHRAVIFRAEDAEEVEEESNYGL